MLLSGLGARFIIAAKRKTNGGDAVPTTPREMLFLDASSVEGSTVTPVETDILANRPTKIP